MLQGWLTVVLVALGGGLGGMGRLFVSRAAASRFGSRFPWGTLGANLLGAFAIGWLAAALSAGASALAPLLLVGVLGGFTTVSSFSLQTLDLLREGRMLAAAANVTVTLGLGLAAAGLGAMVGAPA